MGENTGRWPFFAENFQNPELNVEMQLLRDAVCVTFPPAGTFQSKGTLKMEDQDLSQMSLEELKALRTKVTRAIETFEDRRRKEALALVEAKARELGFSISELCGPQRNGSMPRPPKYRHPENPNLTWSGRGRQPQWFKDALENGAEADDFLIRA